MRNPLIFITLIFGLNVGAACSNLTATDAALIQTGDAMACAGLSFIPVFGGAMAGACAGEEANLKKALDADLAKRADAGTPPPVNTNAAAAPVHRKTSTGKVKLVGYVPPDEAPGCQAELDAQGAGDAGKD